MSGQEPSFISLITRTIDSIIENLLINPPKAALLIYQLLALVEPAQQEKIEDYPVLLKDTFSLIDGWSSVWSPDDGKLKRLQGEYVAKNWDKYHEVYSRATAILHLCGYFKWDTFTKFHDPSGGRRSGDDVIYETRRNK